MPEEQRELRRKWNKEHPEINRMKGKKHSAETKAAMSEARKGAGNANWKGGITAKIRRLRKTPDYLKWRKIVIERAKGICEKCGEEGKLQAHHIVSVHKDLSLALDPANGQALCSGCHAEVDRRGLY